MSKSITEQDFYRLFPDNDTCLEHLFRTNYPHPKCDKCGRVGKFYKHPKRACYSCACGQSHIFPKKGTIFQGSRTDLVKWFHAVFEISVSKNGMAARELQRKVGVSLETAWRMLHQIRRAMEEDELGLLSGTVEADETYIGSRTKGDQGRSSKQVVFGAVERGGSITAKVVEDTSKHSLFPILRSSVAKGTKLLTDQWSAYRTISQVMEVEHETINHKKSYAEGIRHTNTIEGFWSQMKRSLDGTHHVVSPKYLPLYVAEYQWRYNHRQVADPFLALLGASTYKHERAGRRIGCYRWAV